MYRNRILDEERRSFVEPFDDHYFAKKREKLFVLAAEFAGKWNISLIMMMVIIISNGRGSGITNELERKFLVFGSDFSSGSVGFSMISNKQWRTLAPGAIIIFCPSVTRPPARCSIQFK